MAQKERTIKITLNGREVYGYPGQRLLDLCAECGVEIPALCYDPHISMYGGCSICLVEIQGAKALARACATTINPGMIVKTDTDRVRKTRKLGLELLLSDHVGDCRPPCTLACPARGDVQGYVNLAAQGKFEEALDVLHRNMALPTCIGRICPAPCQEKCRRNLVDDEPVSIREIKRFIGDYCMDKGDLGPVPAIEENGRSVAVVGGGPAGISAAYYLRLKGYAVDLFDKEPFFGGMMRYGIPDYRLPQQILQNEIDWVLDHGIQAFPNTALGKDIHMEELREKYDAVILAMGCWKSSPLRAPGEELPGVVGGIDFLYKVNRHEDVAVGKSVAVVGGGNTAMDACRCAKRLGAEKVTVVYRRTRAEMPAEPIEVEEAMEEGVEFVFLAAPQAVEGSGKVERMICEKMELGEPDASGRRRPVATGETFVLEVDQVIAAIGQQLDPAGLPKEVLDGKRMVSDEHYATPLPGVFVAGDQKTGPDIAIAAIGTGHWAAESAHHYITKGTPKAPFEYDVVQKDLTAEDFADKEKTERQFAHHDAPEVRMQQAKIFEEYNHGLTHEQTLKDAERCMECGCPDLFECKLRKYAIDYEVNPDRVAGEHLKGVEEVNEYYVRNMDKCILCGRCIRACNELAGFHAIDFTKRGFAANVDTPYWNGIEASECTQCGLCVQLCPVGALLEKRAPRWPHSEVPNVVPTACGQCSVGCQIDLNLDTAKSRIVRITSDLDNPASVTSGITCAKGRFDFAPLLENRLEAPLVKGAELPWNKALDSLKDALGKAGKAGIIAGDALSNEEYLALKRFAGDVLEAPFAVAGTDAFAPARKAMTEVFGSLETGATYGDLQEADAVLLVEADLDAKQPALVSLLRRGMRNKKTRMIFLGGKPGMLERGEAISLQPREGSMTDLLKGFAALTLAAAGKEVPEELKSYTAASVAERTGVSRECLEEAAKAFGGARKALALLGSLAGACPEKSATLAKLLGQINQKRLIPLYEGSNLGGAAKAVTASVADIVASVKSKSLKGLVLVNLDPASVGLTPADCKALDLCVVITPKAGEDYAAYQLPLANWMERDGTITALSGEQVEQKRSLPPRGVSAELCWILSNLSRRLGTELPAAWGAYSAK